MKRIAIIGAGISGLTTARLLKDKAKMVIFEKAHKAGGLIRCERINGSIFHTCGGHVFNTRNTQVADWFWSHFSKEEEFVKTDRNSVIFLHNGQQIPYPIENFIYLLEEHLQQSVINDLLAMPHRGDDFGRMKTNDFQSFLRHRFGETLYKLYFEPYNKKIWLRELSNVPTDWLEGKLPMPTPEEIIYNNFNRIAEKQFVHSTFFYERNDGSQLIADRFADGLDIRYNSDIQEISYRHTADNRSVYCIDGEDFDCVVFCGNIQDLPALLQGVDISNYAEQITDLQSHGTTSVFCEIDANPYSWIYLPDTRYRAHRIICTGNFSANNNSVAITRNRITATVEFTDYISTEDILDELQQIPLHSVYITHQYTPVTYPIQNKTTRQTISLLKQHLAEYGFYLTGRFADWEYYNMDAAIAAAMQTTGVILKNEHINF